MDAVIGRVRTQDARTKAGVMDVEKIVSDQQHINTAYVNVRDALNEILQVRDMDGELHRLLKDLYRFEDVLWQYTTTEG